jgi:adenosylcobinamide-phosphate synthase
MLSYFCLPVILFDALFGEPPARFHPTVWIGRLIAALERAFYRKEGAAAKLAGIVLVALTVLTAGGAGWLFEFAATRFLPPFWAACAVAAAASAAIGLRSLLEHTAPVLRNLAAFKTPEARKALSRIVGRDTESLSRPEICRASVETAAESIGDGVISPLLYFALFGLPGIYVYRAVNTMDSMIGHKDERYLSFGWAAARLDDVLNYPAARLLSMPSIVFSALFFRSPLRSLKCALRFHADHKSPNSGWLEAAAAGALGVRLGGANWYGGEKICCPVINPDGAAPSARDIRRVNVMAAVSCVSCAAALDVIVFFISY